MAENNSGASKTTSLDEKLPSKAEQFLYKIAKPTHQSEGRISGLSPRQTNVGNGDDDILSILLEGHENVEGLVKSMSDTLEKAVSEEERLVEAVVAYVATEDATIEDDDFRRFVLSALLSLLESNEAEQRSATLSLISRMTEQFNVMVGVMKSLQSQVITLQQNAASSHVKGVAPEKPRPRFDEHGYLIEDEPVG